jgi:anthranilate synthase component 2
MILLIDNYDSFVYNLYQYIGTINNDVKVFRNDKISIEEIRRMNPSHIVLSPGPKDPKDAGICMEIVKELYKEYPILGICLGHQAIGAAFGGKITYAKELYHGKYSMITHEGKGVFQGIKSPCQIARYHSLAVEDGFSNEFEILATKSSISIIELKEEKANEVLKSMMERVLKEQKAKRPFAHTGKFKDAGFKDNIIWESILNYEELKNFDKLIFLTKDGDYVGCEYEFRGRWNKHIEILKDEAAVIAELEKDYKNYIDYRQLYEYAHTAYFKDYLSDMFTPKTTVFFEEEDCIILNFKIEKYCSKVEMAEDEDGDFTMPVIFSKVIINAKKPSEDKVDIPLEIQTKYTDIEYKEFVSIEGIETLN